MSDSRINKRVGLLANWHWSVLQAGFIHLFSRLSIAFIIKYPHASPIDQAPQETRDKSQQELRRLVLKIRKRLTDGAFPCFGKMCDGRSRFIKRVLEE
jgi:hypothetical protein